MKITVWGINFSPEATGIGPCTTELATFLAARGHSTRVVTTFPYYPAWKKRPEDRATLYRTETTKDVVVNRCWHYVPQRVTALKRILHEASFVVTSFLRQLWLEKPDLLIVISPPLLLGAAGWLLSQLQGTRLHLHVQDLQPDAAASLGLIKSKWLLRTLRALEKFSYERSDTLSGISTGMLDVFKSQGVAEGKLRFLPNPISIPAERPKRGQFRQRHQIPDDVFLAIYSGNLGQKQGLETLVETAPLLKGSKIRLMLCGDGAQRAQLAQMIEASGSREISLLPLQSTEHYAELMADADLCLIPQQTGTGRFFFPSKLLSALAHAKPIIAIADPGSDLVRLLEANRFGFQVRPGRPSELAQTLQRAAEDREQLQQMSWAGQMFVRQFDPELVFSRFEAEMSELVFPSEKIVPLPAVPNDSELNTPFSEETSSAKSSGR